MRDSRFVAVHRGGLLTKENHRLLMRWARECSERVLPLLDGNIDARLIRALHVAEEWENGRVPSTRRRLGRTSGCGYCRRSLRNS
jgi:hypothetical protein